MKLTEQQRAERVLVAHGRAAGMLGSFPEDVQGKLAEFCSDSGEIKVGSWDEIEKVLTDHWDSQKAAVDSTEKVEVKGENLTTTTTVGTADGSLVKDWKPEDEVKHGS